MSNCENPDAPPKKRIKREVPKPTRDVEIERKWAHAPSFVVGIDEAGRGPLAGPVVACAFWMGENFPDIPSLHDSKKLTEKRREAIFSTLEALDGTEACCFGVGIIGVDLIDEVNILNANYIAMAEAIMKCRAKIATLRGIDDDKKVLIHAMVDGDRAPVSRLGCDTAESIVGGDATCLNIAAASVVAKVTRDRIMIDLDATYPEFGFAKHKGYGTAAHMKMIREGKYTPVHRRSFQPLKGILAPADI